MKNLNSVLVIMIFLMIACKCSSSSDSTTAGNETKTTESSDSGSMEYLLNGEKITTQCGSYRVKTENHPNVFLSISGSEKKGGSWTIGFTLNADSPKSYSLVMTDAKGIFRDSFGSLQTNKEQVPNSSYHYTSGQVTIDSLDGEGGGKISGSFNAVAINKKNVILNITEGKIINCPLAKGISNDGIKPKQ